MRRRPYLLGHGSRVDVDLTLRLQDEGGRVRKAADGLRVAR
jgi:hypothetical protein